MRRLLALFACALLSVGFAACGDDDDDDVAVDDVEEAVEDTTDDTTDDGAEPSGGAATVGVAESDIGELLVDEAGMTLYLFTNDSEGTSACTGQCEENWPPLVVDGDPTAGDGVDESLLGTIEREDGSTQVTYNGRPLYTYAADQAPGDTTGHGVGDVWFAVGPDGEGLPVE